MNRFSKIACPAFTLVELMISLALMVILMLGVNYIFTSVGQATGSAQALSKIGRDSQASSNVLSRDFASLAPDGPCFLINSQVQGAFDNQQDQLGAKDPANPAIDDDGNPIKASAYNYRNHRIDIVSFFARNSFQRMTGNDGELVNDMSSNEAWIWYGHLMLTDNATPTPAIWRMGSGTRQTNPNNFFASQWALGRVAMLLADPDTSFSPPRIVSNGVNQRFILRKTPPSQYSLAPLSQGSQVDNAGTPTSSVARYDLAGTSINAFTANLNAYISAPSYPGDWWGAMMLDDQYPDPFVASERRFRASTYITKPINSAGVASQVPIFLNGCSQFIVEFAGDFFTQDATTGAVTKLEPDKEIDYVIVPNIQTPAKSVRQIRWYGMPRDVASPIDTAAGTTGQPDGIIKGDGPSENMYDVVPMRDVMAAATPVITPPTVFVERKYPTHMTNYAQTADLPVNFIYRAAWGPDVDTPRPSMIRLVITQNDANGRIKSGVTSEYVFKMR